MKSHVDYDDYDDIDDFSTTTTSSSRRRELSFKASAYFNCAFDTLGRSSASVVSSSASSSSSFCSDMSLSQIENIRRRREAARLKFEELRLKSSRGTYMPSTISCSTIRSTRSIHDQEDMIESPKLSRIIQEHNIGEDTVQISSNNKAQNHERNNIDCDQNEELILYEVHL